MECSVITTYRCNARCSMCHTWQFPSDPSKEFKPKLLEKLPSGLRRLNITGGEPMLRNDIYDIVDILNKKTNRLEISSNGYFYDRLVKIGESYPSITIRLSIEGLPRRNDQLRGIENGFERTLRAILKLKSIGVRDIGFAMTISGENCKDLLNIYALVCVLDIELANAIVHNSFYFHKQDNHIHDIAEVEAQLARFIEALLQSKRSNLKRRIKDWFRGYINLGLLKHIKGGNRLLTCGAGSDSFFIDPYGHVLACNGSKQPMLMGDLHRQSFDEIWDSLRAKKVRNAVANCNRNCWMTGTAVPAMRRKPWVPSIWVLKNKLLLTLGKPLTFF